MRLIAALCLVFLSATPVARAAVVGYQYSGNVSFVFPVFPPNTPPFGIAVPSSANVSGKFWYDTLASGTPGGSEFTTTYWQPHYLTLEFSAPGFLGLTAFSFGYQMEVSNNLPQGPSSADIVSFIFADTIGLGSIWKVNGTPQSNGLLRLNFQSNSLARQDESIPEDLSFAPLPQPGQFFADTGIGGIDVIFDIQSLTSIAAESEPPPIPEPSALILACLGATVAGLYSCWKAGRSPTQQTDHAAA